MRVKMMDLRFWRAGRVERPESMFLQVVAGNLDAIYGKLNLAGGLNFKTPPVEYGIFGDPVLPARGTMILGEVWS